MDVRTLTLTPLQKVYDIIHPERRNLTAIRGYKRIGGLPDDPHTDPQDRSWYGPHDRLFTEEEGDEMKFQTGPEYGEWTRSRRVRVRVRIGLMDF